jgi:hypothetical protein
MLALRLPTMIVDRNEEYAKEIDKRGHTISFASKRNLSRPIHRLTLRMLQSL